MAVYKCESCGGYYDAPYCEKEQRELTHEVDEAAVPRDALDAMIARSSAEFLGVPRVPRVPRSGEPLPPPASSPSEELRGTPRTSEEPTAATRERAIRGLAEFNGYLAEGRKAIVICGSSRSGKSEIASGYVRASTNYRGRAELQTLRSASKQQFTLGGTNPQEVWFQPAGERHIFLDPSGEFFSHLSPGMVDDYHFDFVRSAVAKLAGVVLVFDLHKVLEGDHSLWLEQERNLLFILAALRWLRFDRAARPENLGVGNTIAARAANLPRLDVPVVVFFSKGDLIPDYTRQSPLRFAKRNLRTLHGALMTHAKRYRYDFCHTMKQTGAGERAVDPCGVLLALEWLMDDRFRWLPRAPSYLLGGGK